MEHHFEKMRLVSPETAALILSVSLSTLRRLVRDGKLARPIKVSPNRVAFHSVDLTRYINKQEETWEYEPNRQERTARAHRFKRQRR